MQFFQMLQNYSDFGLLVLRVGVGVIFLVHGYQKTKMWAMQPSEQMPAKTLNMLKFLAVPELLGGIAMVTGFLTQLASLGLAIIMVGAAHMKMSKWGKKFTGDGGWELDFIILAACVALYFTGAGTFGLDRMFFGL